MYLDIIEGLFINLIRSFNSRLDWFLTLTFGVKISIYKEFLNLLRQFKIA